jgi:hypothetical protein
MMGCVSGIQNGRAEGRTECDGVDVLVEDERERNREIEDREALRADIVRKDLKRVRDDEGREGNAVMIDTVVSLGGKIQTRRQSTHS